jgi:hypothetical protein
MVLNNLRSILLPDNREQLRLVPIMLRLLKPALRMESQVLNSSFRIFRLNSPRLAAISMIIPSIINTIDVSVVSL